MTEVFIYIPLIIESYYQKRCFILLAVDPYKKDLNPPGKMRYKQSKKIIYIYNVEGKGIKSIYYYSL